MTKYNNSGWFKQHDRHVKAAKYGKAGGIYVSKRINKIMSEHPEYKDLSFKQLKNKGIFLKYQADSDKDGKVNIRDCKPLDSKKQDDNITLKPIEGTKLYEVEEDKQKTKTQKIKEAAKKSYEKTKSYIKKEAPIVGAWLKKEATALREEARRQLEEYRENKRAAVDNAIIKAQEKQIADIKTEEEKENMIEELQGKEAIHDEGAISNVFTRELDTGEAERIAFETSKSFTRAQHKKIDDLRNVDIKELNDEELKTISVRLGTGFFEGGTKYENELKRRIRERQKIQTELKIELEKARINAQKKLEELRNTTINKEEGKSLWQQFWSVK